MKPLGADVPARCQRTLIPLKVQPTLLALFLAAQRRLCFPFIRVFARRIRTRTHADEFHSEFAAEDCLGFVVKGGKDLGIGPAEDCEVSASGLEKSQRHTLLVDVVFPQGMFPVLVVERQLDKVVHLFLERLKGHQREHPPARDATYR